MMNFEPVSSPATIQSMESTYSNPFAFLHIREEDLTFENMEIPVLRRSTGRSGSIDSSDLDSESHYQEESFNLEEELDSNVSSGKNSDICMSASAKYQCGICYHGYDLGRHKPLSLNCGHTMCATCVGTLYKRRVVQCPFDKREFQYSAFRDIGRNYTLMELVEEELKTMVAVEEDASPT